MKYNYPRFKVRIAPDSGKIQGLRQGDIVRRQYADNTRTIYSLMVVLDTGEETIESAEGIHTSPYFVGALIEGDEPRDGELLDFVRVSNLVDPDRCGAMYLTASDAEAPYMDVLDGVGIAHSLCRPSQDGGEVDGLGIDCYTCRGASFLITEYKSEEDGVRRIFRMIRNASVVGADTFIGLQQNLGQKLANSQRVIISYKIRASKPLSTAMVFGCTDDGRMDGNDLISVTTAWQYHLSIIAAEYPSAFRSIYLNLATSLEAGDWLELADMNVNLVSDISTFAGAMKVRVGKVSGIVDPLFGVLDGYGAYFQNLYATRNVSVAGTLTAGDEEGFSSTFYVGKIHKNCFRNSLQPKFVTEVVSTVGNPPAGVGEIYLLPIGSSTIECQSEQWVLAHNEQQYCFSFWAYSSTPHTVTVEYGGETVGVVDMTEQWMRYHVPIHTRHIIGESLQICLRGTQTTIFASPQLEAGLKPTLYQPTDDILTETDEYGAWFSRGGIGGTIQHPLLKMEADGSIRSANGSFVINADGTGYFAGGRFRWTKDTIALQGVTIRWEDFDQAAQDALSPKYVAISGTNTFHYTDALIPEAYPSTIILIATEQNFTASIRRWDYLSADGIWRDAGSRDTTFQLFPNAHAWENREVLTLRYTATYLEKEYTETFTVTKQYDGESAYSVYIKTDRGTILQNGLGETTLSAYVMRGSEDVTPHISESQFRWTRQSDNPDNDTRWNNEEHIGRSLIVNSADVLRKAVFNCDVTIKYGN